MFAFVLCLVFNAHPDFWLADELFDLTNLRMGEAHRDQERLYVSLANSHTMVAMKIGEDLHDARMLVVRMEYTLRDIEQENGRLRLQRTRQRLLALTAPAAYHRLNRPWDR